MKPAALPRPERPVALVPVEMGKPASPVKLYHQGECVGTFATPLATRPTLRQLARLAANAPEARP